MLAGLLLYHSQILSRVGILWATFWGVFYVIGCNSAQGFTVCAPILLTRCHDYFPLSSLSGCLPCARYSCHHSNDSRLDAYRTGSGSCV